MTYPGTLQAVSSVSTSDVWAVGFHADGADDSTSLIEHWDGHVWKQVDSPHPRAGSGSWLYGVSARSSSDAWAVGTINGGSEYDTLVLHWDGRSWSQVPSPSPGGSTGSYLMGVSAISADDAWAVGRTYDGPLTLHWDGSTWSQVDSPGGVGTSLSGVVALSSTDAFAVGNTYGPFSRPFLLRWDGIRWRRLDLRGPDKMGHGEDVAGVSASSANDVWAVGTTVRHERERHLPLVLHWDGSTWQHVPSLNPGGRFGAQLDGVKALAGDDVWAVGSYGTGRGGLTNTFAEHWDGHVWTKVHTPHPGNYHESQIHGIDAVSASRAFAAGDFVDSGSYRSMTLNWDGSRWIQL